MGQMRLASIVVLAVLGGGSAVPSAAVAGSTDPGTSGGRFVLAPTPNGVMRLDTETGVVSLCTVVNGAPECRAGTDERSAMESEIARLTRENAELKARPGNPPASVTAKPPSDEDVDRALSMMEKFVRRMMQIMKSDESGDPI
jgi:hypothetical protein